MNHKSEFVVFLILALVEHPYCKKSAQGFLDITLCAVFVPFLKLIMAETFSFIFNNIIRKIFRQEDAFGAEVDLWATRIFFIWFLEVYFSAFNLQLPLFLMLLYMAARWSSVNFCSLKTRCTSLIASLYSPGQGSPPLLNYPPPNRIRSGNRRMSPFLENENNTPGAGDETNGTTNVENQLMTGFTHPEGTAIEVRSPSNATSNNHPDPSSAVRATLNACVEAAVLLLGQGEANLFEEEMTVMESPPAPAEASMNPGNRVAPVPTDQSNREENAESQVQYLVGNDQAAMDDNEWRLVELRTHNGFIITKHYYNIRTGVIKDAN